MCIIVKIIVYCSCIIGKNRQKVTKLVQIGTEYRCYILLHLVNNGMLKNIMGWGGALIWTVGAFRAVIYHWSLVKLRFTAGSISKLYSMAVIGHLALPFVAIFIRVYVNMYIGRSEPRLLFCQTQTNDSLWLPTITIWTYITAEKIIFHLILME